MPAPNAALKHVRTRRTAPMRRPVTIRPTSEETRGPSGQGGDASVLQVEQRTAPGAEVVDDHNE